MFNWVSNYLYKKPIWVSEDLRDGNQSLINGYNLKDKIHIWEFLIEIGIKQIVLGFPSSNKHDFNFINYLKKNKLIPNDVFISVLTPAKTSLIDITINSLNGINNSVIHLYNSISKIQRKLVFKMNKIQIKNFTIEFFLYVINKIKKKNIIFQYSPESFSDCELMYSKKICYMFSYLCYINNIKSIINLPITVENILNNKFINLVSYIKKKIFNSQLSIHTHNDMGGSVSSSLLSILSGVDRIEGTLLGNGERSGNSPIMILASNYYNLGINPGIDLFNHKIFKFFKKNYKKRIPWYSNLNYIAFSGSHQDAINKSYFKKKLFNWNVIYVPINPKIYNFKHKNMIKINIQSGKGGIKFIFKYNYKIKLNKLLLIKLYFIIQDISEYLMTEIYKEMIFSILIIRSNLLFINNYKIIFLNISYFYNFKVLIIVFKKKKKKIIKNITYYYE
ncbi:2-isopropylmalate synthase [Candidatus Carsonella ruddii]|uniref:2-isopropylmalate synthase n=1 Tax=Candidatus Carsonella ruddii PC isolate NHV TaxID=1202540 RepID=J3TWI6_CARRU|nr:2-isopropylmalate synthase [Candidatus Carsonella ruddii]AFP84305.1 2-isopropylmalate synthase [Candidatus Carsonella ruddii PC isolate NHV]